MVRLNAGGVMEISRGLSDQGAIPQGNAPQFSRAPAGALEPPAGMFNPICQPTRAKPPQIIP